MRYKEGILFAHHYVPGRPVKQKTNYYMIRNYFKIAWRNIVQNKVYSAINIVGLAIGIVVVMLIGLWIWDETQYNRQFAHYDRIVRVLHNSTHGTETLTHSSMPIPLSADMRTRYASDLKYVVLCSGKDAHILAIGDKKLKIDGYYIQPEFTTMVSLPMISGSAGLSDPSSILLSKSMATALFGGKDPLGQPLKVDNKALLKVTGVYEDFPYSSNFRDIGFLATWENYLAGNPWVKSSQTEWNNNGFNIYAQLQDGANVTATAAKVKDALTGHDRKDKPEVLLLPMSRWHLYAEFKNGKNTGGAIQFVWMFGIIGAFVLLLACINFMNLSTARSERRAKEVGIRKAIGSLRGQLILQFLSESVMVAGLAMVLALMLLKMSLPWFNQLADKQMTISWGDLRLWILVVGFTAFAGLLSGSYPAFYLSSFQSVKVLKGVFKAGRLAALPRKILIILQFTVSISLIIATVIVFQQVMYVKDRPVGYSREGLLSVDINTDELSDHFKAVREELLATGAVMHVGGSSTSTTGSPWGQSGFSWEGKDPAFTPSFDVFFITPDFVKTIGLQLAAGRDFSTEYATDSAAFVINEAAVKYMSMKQPLGATVKYLYSERKDQNYHVVGVVKDMVTESPYERVKPAIFMINNGNVNVISVKVNPAMSMTQALPTIAAVFQKYNPSAPFDFRFTNEEYAKKFRAEERVGKLAGFFTLFAVFISCLGLFGLASFTAEQRRKEIGVRKVLGASVGNLWGLLSKEFVVLVALSFVIALPLSWWGMHNWLQQYDYRTGISFWIFAGTLGVAMLITLATVSVQAIRAAVANPVKSLRSE